MHIYLFNKNTKKYTKVNIKDDMSEILANVYDGILRVPSNKMIKKLTEKHGDVYDTLNNMTSNAIKRVISNVTNLIPLFSVHQRTIFMIHAQNVYYRVIYADFRFPDEEILDAVKKSKYNDKEKIIKFMTQINIKTLYKSYTFAFYNSSPTGLNNVLTCRRPSFIMSYYHLKPYYTRNELIAIGKNNNIDTTNIRKLCKQVSENDINAHVLISHQEYITSSDSFGLIKYYTLQGSSIINKYMRKQTSYTFRHVFLEQIIESLYNLVANAPEFDNDYYLYRFVQNDSFLQNVNVGDIFKDSGFLSSTRNPFYVPDNYDFGFVLIKIKIPKNVRGCGLCVELVSHFPAEQEIIFAPYSVFKLVAKDSDVSFYHTMVDRTVKINTRYEFEFVQVDELVFNRVNTHTKIDTVNFLKIQKQIRTTDTKIIIDEFIANYVNSMNLFYVVISNHKLPIFAETYDSSGAYMPFYAITTSNGFSMYSFYDNFMLFMIEIGVGTSGMYEIHVNYQLCYTRISRQQFIAEDDFFEFIASISYYFRIPNTIIHSDFVECNQLASKENIENQLIQRDKKNQFAHTIHHNKYYSKDIYDYFKTKAKRYDLLSMSEYDLTPCFLYTGYGGLDRLSEISAEIVLDPSDRDELLQVFKNAKTEFHSVKSFYVYLVENMCWLVSTFVNKLDRYYEKNNIPNPLKNIYYILKSQSFLFNRNLIPCVDDDVIDIAVMTHVAKKSRAGLEYREEYHKAKTMYVT